MVKGITAHFLGLLIIFFCGQSGFSQNKSKDHSPDQYFKEYTVGSIGSDKFTQKKGYGERKVAIDFGPLRGNTLVLYPNDLISEDYRITLASGNSIASNYDLPITLSGFIEDQISSIVRMTIHQGQMTGYVKQDDTTYFIEPADKYSTNQKSFSKDQYIIYTQDQVIISDAPFCTASHVAHQKNKLPKPGRTLKMQGCKSFDMSIALDFSYFTLHGGMTGAIDKSIAVMNLVAGDYDDAFTDEVRFNIVEHWVSDCNTCDPWSPSADANVLLNSFTSWGPSGFLATHDIGQFWTARDIYGETSNGDDFSVLGLAWINVICGPQRYHILEDQQNPSGLTRALVSHEMGHNFGADHVAGNFIMAPSVATSPDQWSTTNIDVINGTLPNYTCAEICFNGSCSEISNAFVSDCALGDPGSSASYNLTVIINHNGGGLNSQGFDVVVNGNSYYHTWLPSPQTVTVSGLIADGTKNNQVVIMADDKSDTGCNGSAVYNEPNSLCEILLEDANFDDCTLPNKWAITTNNPFQWSPGFEYEWKFADANRIFGTYNQGFNTGFTLNGTCMAIMDDNIGGSSPQYTGEAILFTPIYATSEIDVLSLEFTYNFHNNEDINGGGNANNSYFAVEIYNGQNWTSILLDNNDTCPWSDVWPATCADQVNLDISAYANDSMQIRFIYNDGENGAWAGMVAMDNLKISGQILPSNCNNVELMTNPINYTSLEANDTIRNSETIILGQNLSLTAPNVVLNPEFTINTGAVFTVDSDDCN